MTQPEYDQKKRECWEQFCKDNGIDQEVNISIFYTFDQIFDRAYALGKQEETVAQEEIERAAEDYASFEKGGKCILSYIVKRACRRAFKDGANFALGKQEKDMEDPVIQGWVCRDKKDNALYLHVEKPYRAQSGCDVLDDPDWWESDCPYLLPLDKSLFPNLTWESDPIKVSISIKRE